MAVDVTDGSVKLALVISVGREFRPLPLAITGVSCPRTAYLDGFPPHVLRDLQSETIDHTISPEQQTCFLSIGGIGNGAIFLSANKHTVLHLSDSEF